MPSVSLLIKAPIQVLTAPNWLDIESLFMSTFLPLDHSSTKLRHNRHSLTRKVGILHKEVAILQKEVAILHKEVESFTRRWKSFTRRWNPSQGGGILYKEVESFTRKWQSFTRSWNPSQGGGNPSQGGRKLPPPCEGFHLLVKDCHLVVKDSTSL